MFGHRFFGARYYGPHYFGPRVGWPGGGNLSPNRPGRFVIHFRSGWTY